MEGQKDLCAVGYGRLKCVDVIMSRFDHSFMITVLGSTDSCLSFLLAAVLHVSPTDLFTSDPSFGLEGSYLCVYLPHFWGGAVCCVRSRETGTAERCKIMPHMAQRRFLMLQNGTSRPSLWRGSPLIPKRMLLKFENKSCRSHLEGDVCRLVRQEPKLLCTNLGAMAWRRACTTPR